MRIRLSPCFLPSRSGIRAGCLKAHAWGRRPRSRSVSKEVLEHAHREGRVRTGRDDQRSPPSTTTFPASTRTSKPYCLQDVARAEFTIRSLILTDADELAA